MVSQPESLRSLRKASDDGTASGSGTDSPHAHGATDRELHHASLKVASWSSKNGELRHRDLTYMTVWQCCLDEVQASKYLVRRDMGPDSPHVTWQ